MGNNTWELKLRHVAQLHIPIVGGISVSLNTASVDIKPRGYDNITFIHLKGNTRTRQN